MDVDFSLWITKSLMTDDMLPSDFRGNSIHS